MEVKIRETGEIVKIVGSTTEALMIETSNGIRRMVNRGAVERIDNSEKEPEKEPKKDAVSSIDWEQRKWELVKAAMQGLSILRCWNDEKDLAELTIKVADAVLAEYRKGEKK